MRMILDFRRLDAGEDALFKKPNRNRNRAKYILAGILQAAAMQFA